MSVLDRFLNVMRLSEDDENMEEDYLDEEADDYEDDPVPRRRVLKDSEEDDTPSMRVLPSPRSEAQEDESESRRDRERVSPVRSRPASSKVSPIRSKRRNGEPGMSVCVIKPHTMEDASEITETLLANCTVILNVEGLELEIAQRIIDFASGSCYALDGNLQKISNYIFIITPSTVEISGDFQELLTGAFDVPFDKKY